MPSSLIDVIRQHAPTPTGLTAPPRVDEPDGLLSALARVPDPRDRRGIRYSLASLLAVAVCAVLAGGHVRRDDRLGRRPRPGHRPAARVHRPGPGVEHTLAAAGPRRRLHAAGRADRLAALPPARTPAGPADRATRRRGRQGPARRPAARRPAGPPAVGLRHTDGVVLAQVQIAAKSNEIPAFTPLPEQVAARLGSLNNVVFVADALHAQVTHAHQVASGPSPSQRRCRRCAERG
ncbi:transposase family protein [Dactylosporangium sp. CA-152071]|uniref:transposase family protein n=1 Tax=Dactylosporangium sp. CA-152071 TaxID=3239933 RepID=UPI003D89C375